MTKLYPVLFFSLLFSYLAAPRWQNLPDVQVRKKTNIVFFLCAVIVLVLFSGLRGSYNDTGGYTYAYRNMEIGQEGLANLDWDLAANPGFNLLNILFRHLGFSDQTFLMFYAVVTISIYIWFLFRYSPQPVFSVFLLFALGAYTFTMAAIKQCVAIAFLLLATHYAIQKSWGRSIVLVLLASTFHAYSLMFLILPFVSFRPWSIKTILLLFLFAVAGALLQPLLGTIIDVTTMLGAEYTETDLSSDGVNPFRLAVSSVPIILSLLAHKHIRIESDRTQNILLNLSMLNAEIMYVALFGTANYFARLANYFLVFQTISLPWVLSFFEKKSRHLLTVGAVVCYAFYMYYGLAVNEYFDGDYASTITLFGYVRSLLF